MKRRDFVKHLTAGSIGAMAAGCTRSETRQTPVPGTRSGVGMKPGCQFGGVSKRRLEMLARCGVFHYDPGSPETIEGVGWNIEDARRQVEACQEHGITLAAFHLPLTSGGIETQKFPNIMLGRGPERDREIEIIQQMISVAGRVGVPLLLYNTTILPVLRTGRTTDPARGNAAYSTWDFRKAVEEGQDRQMTVAGEVSIDEMYERIHHLLERILPVAEEYKVRLGNHIPDPPAPAGFRGITRWNSPHVFEGIKRFAGLSDSEYHGFNLCIGSVAQGLRDPRTEICPIVKWVGERRQIFNVHLRNIRGGWNRFEEVYPDNGDMSFVQVMRTLRDVGYDGMVMPDHLPSHPDPAARNEGFAFAYGYIKALIQVLEEDAAGS